MNVTEVTFVLLRWVHGIAAAAWVGGGLFYLLILRPWLRRHKNPSTASIAKEFRAMVTTAMGILLVSGVILSFDRITSGFVGASYVLVLTVKIVLALYMFHLVWFLRSKSYTPEPTTPSGKIQTIMSGLSGGATVVVLGIIVFLLADILSSLFEHGLRSAG